jgi:hypothetical protein
MGVHATVLTRKSLAFGIVTVTRASANLRRHMRKLILILLSLLVSCVPDQISRTSDPDEPITWQASIPALEAVVMPILRDFDPSLRNAFTRENGSTGLDVVARGLEDRDVIVLLVKRSETLSFVDVRQIGALKLEPESFAARLERTLLEACAKAFERY